MSFSSNGASIQAHERVKYESIFNSLDPVGGKLPGDKVRPVLLKSNLPIETLGKVWDLSDIDKDGYLDKEEFYIAMHLVYRAIDKEPVPSVLPMSLIPPSKQVIKPTTSISQAPVVSKPLLPGAVCVLPSAPPPPPAANSIASKTPDVVPTSTGVQSTTTAPKTLYVSPADRARYTALFQQHKDQFGYISGENAKLIFMQSSLSQTILADIWSMCDPLQQGRLKHDQFLLAMHLISQTVKGIEIPKLVSPDYLLTSHDSGFGDDGGSISDGSSSVGDTAAIRELDALNKEIEELRKEKEVLSGEVETKEQTVKLASNIVQELQDKLEKDSNTLAQLERDKTDRQTRLEEQEQNRKKLDVMLSDMQTRLVEEKETIKKLNNQLLLQQSTTDMKEKELFQLNKDLLELKKEEMQSEQRLQAEQQQESTMNMKINQAKQETEKVKQAIEKSKTQCSYTSMNISEMEKEITQSINQSTIKDQPTTKPTSAITAIEDNLMLPSQSVFSMGGMQEKIEDLKSDLNENMFKPDEDPFKSGDPFSGSDPFGENNLFTAAANNKNNNDAAMNGKSGGGFPPSSEMVFPPTSTTTNDPFAMSADPTTDPFSSKTDTTSSPVDNPFNDGGSVVDPFMAAGSSSATHHDPFNSSESATVVDPFKGADPFESSSVAEKNNDLATAVKQQPSDVSKSNEMLDESSSVPVSDPFAGSDPFSSASNAFASDCGKFPSDENTGFPAGAAVAAASSDPFNDNTKQPLQPLPTGTQDTNDDFFAFNDFKKQNTVASSGGDDPWGTTSSSLTTSATPVTDPFGTDAFGSAFSSTAAADNAFGKQPWGGASEPKKATAPPLPPQPQVASKLDKSNKSTTDKQKRPMTESEQLAWAQQESNREEDRRRKIQQQEQADLELAIQLSKQQS